MNNEKFFDYIRVTFFFDFFAATTCLPLYTPFSSAKWESPFPAALSATLFQSFRAVSLIQLVVRCLLRCFEVFFFGANDIAKSLYDKNKKICYVRDYIESREECKFFRVKYLLLKIFDFFSKNILYKYISRVSVRDRGSYEHSSNLVLSKKRRCSFLPIWERYKKFRTQLKLFPAGKSFLNFYLVCIFYFIIFFYETLYFCRVCNLRSSW